MKILPARLTRKTPAGFVMLAVILSASACIDNVKPADPLAEEQTSTIGEFIEVVPDVAELPEVGDRIQLSAAVRDARGRLLPGARVKWQAANPGVATVDESGNVTGTGEGLTEIRGINGNISSVSVIAVAKRGIRAGGSSKTSVALSPDSSTVPTVGGTVKLLAVGRNAGGKLISGDKMDWGSTEPSVATVSAGMVTGQRSGSAQIIVVNGGAADTAEVSVAPPNVPAAVVVTPDADTIPTVGGTITLVGQVLNGTGDALQYAVGWSSLDASIATVSASGTVTGLAKGVARIRASYGSLSDTARVWVAQTVAATSVFVTPKVDTIPQVGQTAQITATALDGGGNAIAGAVFSWNSMDPSVATVDATGTVKGISKGTARVIARLGTLVDTATVVVAPVSLPASITITPQADTIATLGTWAVLTAVVKDAQGKAMNVTPAWKSLDPTIASVMQNGQVNALSEGMTPIEASFNGIADTAMVYVMPSDTTGGTTGSPSVRIVPDTATIGTIGGKVVLGATIKDAQGNTITAEPKWATLDPALASVNADGGVTGLANGTARITGTWSGVSDTARVTVASSGGSTSSFYVTPKTYTVLVGGSVQLSAFSAGGATINVTTSAAWHSLNSSVATVSSAGLVTGQSKGVATVTATYSGATDTATITIDQYNQIPTGGNSLTPAPLQAVLGPIVGMGASPSVASLQTYDQRYTSTEYARYQDFLAVENDPSGSYLSAQHYGGLRGRLMWAIRNGQPYGAGVTDETKYAYARGRRIVKRYLQYSKANNFATQAHNNTGLADIEALYVLEGDQDALTHIHVSAMMATTDNWGYLKMQNSNSDARQIAVALQALMAAHRLGIPYVRNPANGSVGFDASLGSWKAAAQRQIDWLTQYNIVHADGSVPSPAHGGTEAYLFNAWLATQLLDWYGYVQADGSVLQMAQRIMDHLIASQRSGWETLPYLANGTTPAYDLAAFYVWPSLVLWQETGDAKYKNFALQNLAAANQAYINNVKQWNQTYSTLGEGAEALLDGVSWR